MSIANMPKKAIESIDVQAKASYLTADSFPEDLIFFWSYEIHIRNLGDKPLNLLTRHWIITNGQGQQQEVRGKGVVGLQPRIMPGESFAYQSYVPLTTPSGFMKGSYTMADEANNLYEVKIPLFYLESPYSQHSIH